ncbi:hypothetical protein [Mariniradius sediminis]|uniref:Uncharacterized protein n=1 Tax=Mariniradius sediminis TaxID=2909237 RepID=A0ABS9BYR5_9BACT|nr:hypothetical protein [Mariniradius sediminis]MCF1753190.1 hypothetical protein [Mariniradius sediminis]
MDRALKTCFRKYRKTWRKKERVRFLVPTIGNVSGVTQRSRFVEMSFLNHGDASPVRLSGSASYGSA